MSTRELAPTALTGPAGACVLGLDGYRDHDWPLRWVTPMRRGSRPDVVRTRRWELPSLLDGIEVAPAVVVLRHLDTTPDRWVDGVTRLERIELATEHALRLGVVDLSRLRNRRGAGEGDLLLSRVLAQRGDEPPTGSHAETRGAQFLRRHGLRAWRQCEVRSGGKVLHVADFVVPYDQSARRPTLLQPDDGVVFEIDGVEPHAEQVERDRRRDLTYDKLGYRWLVATPNQIERDERTVLGGLHRRLRHPPVARPRRIVTP